MVCKLGSRKREACWRAQKETKTKEKRSESDAVCTYGTCLSLEATGPTPNVGVWGVLCETNQAKQKQKSPLVRKLLVRAITINRPKVTSDGWIPRYIPPWTGFVFGSPEDGCGLWDGTTVAAKTGLGRAFAVVVRVCRCDVLFLSSLGRWDYRTRRARRCRGIQLSTGYCAPARSPYQAEATPRRCCVPAGAR